MADPASVAGASIWATLGAAIIAALSPLLVVKFSRQYREKKEAKKEEHADKVLEIDLAVRSQADLIDGFNRLLAAQQARIEQLDLALSAVQGDRESLWKQIRTLNDTIIASETRATEQAKVHAREIADLNAAHKIEIGELSRQIYDLQLKARQRPRGNC